MKLEPKTHRSQTATISSTIEDSHEFKQIANVKKRGRSSKKGWIGLPVLTILPREHLVVAKGKNSISPAQREQVGLLQLSQKQLASLYVREVTRARRGIIDAVIRHSPYQPTRTEAREIVYFICRHLKSARNEADANEPRRRLYVPLRHAIPLRLSGSEKPLTSNDELPDKIEMLISRTCESYASLYFPLDWQMKSTPWHFAYARLLDALFAVRANLTMICTIEHQRHLLAKSGGTAKAKLLRAKEEHARELIRQEIANGHATSDSEVAENLLGKGGFKYGKLATLARDELRKKRSS